MKTKLLFAFCLLTLVVEYSFSQAYTPMLNNSSWNIIETNGKKEINRVINPGIDYYLNSSTYSTFIDPTISGRNNEVCLREDTSTRKVYRIIDGEDHLLYDFSLQVGDSILLDNGKYYKVSSITNINVIGGTRRRFNLIHYTGNVAGYSEAWIEGVGSYKHPLAPFYALGSDPEYRISCSAQNGINIYNWGIERGTSSSNCSMLLNQNNLNDLEQDLTFSPNPFKTELLITTTVNFESTTLKLFNSFGQLVKEINNINGQKIIIKRENLKSGIYLCQLIQNGKLISIKKIMIAD
ncbi:MAG: T9SS type A sorting domain-containing protein [Saprospiraceae bacterium]|nr:T9SS type A sorting domain-containing protein [Saprospiraceae bacterium]